MEPLTDADLSRLVTLVVIHEGESQSMCNRHPKRLAAHGMIEINNVSDESIYEVATVTPQGRALVDRMLAAGRANV